MKLLRDSKNKIIKDRDLLSIIGRDNKKKLFVALIECGYYSYNEQALNLETLRHSDLRRILGEAKSIKNHGNLTKLLDSATNWFSFDVKIPIDPNKHLCEGVRIPIDPDQFHCEIDEQSMKQLQCEILPPPSGITLESKE